MKAYVEAWKRYSEYDDNPYYLVIEEINRGNCAQIFGDLFQLLDRNSVGSSSYAISADEDIAQFLRDDKNGFAGFSEEQKDVIRRFVLKKDSGSEEHIGASILNGSKLLLPPNMRIWATMNTSDQSLFPIDSAFKRRWNWEYMPIEYDKKDWTFVIGNNRYRWGDFLKEINPKIFKLTQSEDKQMGYFFAKPDKKSKDDLTENDTISTKVFVNKVLFYLWTDVFKDYDLTEEPFVYEDEEGKKVAYRFTDFFSTNGADMLTRFIDGIKLPVIGEQEQNETPNVEVSGEFSVNGTPVRWQNGVPAVAVKEYLKLYPEKTAAEVIQDWRSLGQMVSHFIETKAENEDRTDKDKTYVVEIDCNGEPIYVSKQGWGDNRPNGSYYALLNLVNAIRTKGWPIDIKGVE